MKPSLVIVALGNPGNSYARTRHNAGFRALDVLSEAFGVGEWEERKKFLSRVQEARVVAAPVLLIKPQTYMNRSGEAVRKIVDFYKIASHEGILILADDVDLPLGEVRLRRKGGPGTHNGLKSIVEALGEDFSRIRIGLGQPPPDADLASWVLSVPSPEEENLLEKAYSTLPDLVRSFVMGVEKERQ